MKNKIDKILLGLLWLLAITLGASFWFNTVYGFNIFASQHWQYLGFMQASQTPIRTTFYISLILAVIIAFGGLYILVRPKFRNFRLPIIRIERRPKQTNNTPQNPPIQKQIDAPSPVKKTENHAHTADTPTNETASTLDILTPEQTPAPIAPPMPSMPRPPRLKMPVTSNYTPAPTATNNTPTPNTSSLVTNTPDVTDMPIVREIFRDAGYAIKTNPKISGVQTTLIAVGTNEVLWIGAVGVKTTDMRRAVETMQSVFVDTLEDIEIGINAFVINAPDAATSEFQDILMFDSADQLRQYISEHPNTPPDADDQENFDAYSEYIDTVLTYLGKM